MFSRPSFVPIERSELRHVTLKLPPLKGRALQSAMRLQLLPYAPAGARLAFVYREQGDGQTHAWLWQPAADVQASKLRQHWPEPLLEQAGQGPRLLARGAGSEAQYWVDGELRLTRWWPSLPTAQDWALFVRAAGLQPDDHPLPQRSAPAKLGAPSQQWLRGDNLPAADPWAGWRWQAAVLLLGGLIAFGIGAHLQTLHQLRDDQALLKQLRSEREQALGQRSRYLSLRDDFDALRALAPRSSQLELLDKVVASGILAAPPGVPPVAASAPPATPGAITAPPTNAAVAAPVAPSLAEWDYRNSQLKLTLDIPEGQLVMLDITRRIERLQGFSDVRIGLDSSNTSLILNMRVVGP
ncbi:MULTISPECIES: hypothetical protein [unclassified Roseateles]|uniref:hypothetical protein n=1 Tax=unclassified Roseateles TaxID=2626991 RepID=UPI0006FA2FAF|nr:MULTISPECIES: hypothetical protein [unclassified Roseateles]KQW42092.1 hypothetical protein ASC81_22590 [Pelomonas sp. Root405]KRA67695.1 hypothetical protein ASD88_24175 [Pelomonas sp. Root662]